MVTGVLLIGLALWLGGDAIVRGSGHTPWLALAGLLLALPLITAFTVRPAVFANDDRLRVRNPFRSITVPWAAVETLRSGYSTELLAGGRKYQMWALPVSLRARKRATRRATSALAAGDPRTGRPGAEPEAVRSWADQTVVDLRDLAERNASSPSAQGVVTVRWAYEIIAPAVAGAIVLAILLAIGG